MMIMPSTKRILFLNSLVLKAWINVLTWGSFPYVLREETTRTCNVTL